MKWIIEAETLEDMLNGNYIISTELTQCEECKHYHADIFGSELKLPSMYDYIIVAHHGCKRWSQDENDMKGVKPDGYCFLAERRTE